MFILALSLVLILVIMVTMEKKKKLIHHHFEADAHSVLKGFQESPEMRWEVDGRQSSASFASRASSRSLEL